VLRRQPLPPSFQLDDLIRKAESRCPKIVLTCRRANSASDMAWVTELASNHLPNRFHLKYHSPPSYSANGDRRHDQHKICREGCPHSLSLEMVVITVTVEPCAVNSDSSTAGRLHVLLIRKTRQCHLCIASNVKLPAQCAAHPGYLA
jgi:hypothetical protein